MEKRCCNEGGDFILCVWDDPKYTPECCDIAAEGTKREECIHWRPEAAIAYFEQFGEGSAEGSNVCEWTRPKGWNGMYDTGCGHLLDYEETFKFCPYCGKRLVVK